MNRFFKNIISIFAIIIILLCANKSHAQSFDDVPTPIADTAVAEYNDEQDNSDYEDYENKDLKESTEEAIKNEKQYNHRNIDASTWQKMHNGDDFIYSREEQKEKPKKEKENTTSNFPDIEPIKVNPNVGVGLLYILAAAVILVIIYVFFGDKIFAKKDKTLVKNNDDANWEDVSKFDKWEDAINKAIAAGDYRLATRIMYLQIIQKMDVANIIEYKKETTNSAYASALYGTSYFEPFIKSTRVFDYVWYGKRDVDEHIFKEIKNEFALLSRMLN
jgi:hypothetical protein